MKPIMLVVGSLNMDLVVQAPRHPQPGETLLGTGFTTFPGGKGANQAVAASKLGGAVAMIGRVGRDAFGSVLLEELKQAGVDAAYVARDESAPTGVALITVDDQGQNTIVVVPGANGCLTVADIEQAELLFKRAAILLVQLECPLATVHAAAAMAYRYGVPVVLNPAPAAALPPGLIELTDYLIPNQHELALLTGETSLESGAAVLHARGAKHVLVTLGDKGMYYTGQSDTFHLPAIPVDVVDTTAAGDAFVGGCALAVAEGRSLMEAARWATAAGALAVTRAGAQSSLPSRTEVEQLLGTLSHPEGLPPRN